MNEIIVKGSDVIDNLMKYKENPALLFDDIRDNVKAGVADILNRVMDVELSIHLGRKPYERGVVEVRKNYRNGYYDRTFAIKGIGKLSLKVPRDRLGEYKNGVIPRYKRHEEKLSEEITALFLAGLSTRNVSLISQRLLGFKVSSSYVSQCNKELEDAIEKWRQRSLLEMHIQFMYIDGVNFDVRIGDSIRKTPVLVAIGVDENGVKHILGFQAGDKESAGTWREFFKDLKARGLDASKVQLGIMDGLPGLETVFAEEFSNAKIQRCQVHVKRNVIAKVPRKMKKEVADDVRSIFYASSREKAENFFEEFEKCWEPLIPSAVKCLRASLDKCLTYYDFDEEYWTALRTTNPIERLNKEYKRRTKPMEIVAGEASLYNILGFVSVKMETGWQKAPIQSDGKKGKTLLEEFTQKT